MNFRFHMALALAAITVAAPVAALADDGVKTVKVPLEKFMPIWKTYLEVPETERTAFKPVFYMLTQKTKLSDLHFRLFDSGKPAPFEVASDGLVKTLPPLDAYRRNAEIEISGPTKDGKFGIGLSLTIVPQTAPSKQIDVAALKLGIKQTQSATKRVAGMFAFVVPKFDRTYVFGTGGRVILNSGESKPLPRAAKAHDVHDKTRTDVSVFVPEDWPNAQRLEFDQIPEYIEIGTKE